MTMQVFLTNPIKPKIDLLNFGFPVMLQLTDANHSRLNILFDQSAWADFSEAVRIFDLSQQPQEIAA